MNLNTDIDKLLLKQGSSTDFEQNINNGSGINIRDLEREGGSAITYGKGVNEDAVLTKIIQDDKIALEHKNLGKNERKKLTMGEVQSMLELRKLESIYQEHPYYKLLLI